MKLKKLLNANITESSDVSMSTFKQYRRTQIAEMRPVNDADIREYQNNGGIRSLENTDLRVSISDADLQNGSPKLGDMIARNPKNHADQWLVAKLYFEDNFEPLYDNQ